MHAVRGLARSELAPARRPIFVGFNAPFDWMFVADYFWRYLGRNPFGISALDLKSYYMGREGVTAWERRAGMHIDAALGLAPDHTHNALDDARGQALLARVLLGREGTDWGNLTSKTISVPIAESRCNIAATLPGA